MKTEQPSIWSPKTIFSAFVTSAVAVFSIALLWHMSKSDEASGKYGRSPASDSNSAQAEAQTPDTAAFKGSARYRHF